MVIGVVVREGMIVAMSWDVPLESIHNIKFLVAWYGGLRTENLNTYFLLAINCAIFTSILPLLTLQYCAVIQVIPD